MSETFLCWCGNSDLLVFSPEYLRCPACETLVSKLPPPVGKVVDDERDFYGRHYWFVHQEKDLGFPNVVDRARTDLSERCLHWLRSILRFKLPPAHLLELGCAHGGFVALLRWAGYDATGLEMSPWIVNFARRTFDVPMLLGPIENQQIEPGALDIIALMDVLEHLPNPVGTMRHCLGLLSSHGALIIQTPRYPQGKTYAEMVAQGDPFLEQLKANEHLYLFSAQSIREFFRRLGVDHLVFEPAIFSHYDMFFVASRAPLSILTQEMIEKSLRITPGGRMIQALLDLDKRNEALKEKLAASAADGAARLQAIQELGQKLDQSEAESVARLKVIQELGQKFDASEANSAARLEAIQDLGQKLDQSEAESAVRLQVIQELGQKFDASEANSAARLEAIQDLGQKLDACKADSAARLEAIHVLNERLRASEVDRAARLSEIERQKNEIKSQAEELGRVRESLQRITSSLSWRATAPFRWVHGKWSDFFHKRDANLI